MAACLGIVEIPRKQDISVEDFAKFHLESGNPVIIEHLAKNWPCMEWSLTSLIEKAGESLVHVRRNTMSENYKTGRKYNIEEMQFREYISNILQNNKKSMDSYLAVQNVKKTFPELENDIPIPPYVGKMHGGPFLWIAREGHYEFCHFDPDDGFLVMISGRKRVRLYGCDIRTMYPNPLGSKGKTVQSQVNCDNPDLDRFPNFTEAVCHECILQAGEMLFIPAFWWHQVTSLSQSISINMFYGDAGMNNYLTKILHSPTIDSFSYWFLNIIEQNRHLDCFHRILSDFKRSFTSFCVKMWKEQPTDEQVDKVVAIVMKYLGIKSLPQLTGHASKHPPLLKIRGLLWRS